MPVPASSGSPRPLTNGPSSPVLSAWSKLRTAVRNCGDAMIRSSVSCDGGVGRSGGRCGKRAWITSGWVANRAERFAGVSTSVREISARRRGLRRQKSFEEVDAYLAQPTRLNLPQMLRASAAAPVAQASLVVARKRPSVSCGEVAEYTGGTT